MSKGVFDSDGAQVDNVTVQYCRTQPEVASINNRTLGGLWFTQTIGSPGIRADVQLVAKGMTAKDNILDFYADGSQLMIKFDGYQRAGYILDLPAIDLIKKSIDVEKRIFTVSFTMGINTEVTL